MTLAKLNSEIQKAYSRIYKTVDKTPLDLAPKLGSNTLNTVWLKREDLQKTHSFKVRGATNAILAELDQARTNGVVTASAGNHAQGIAKIAEELEIPVRVYMPEVTPNIKVEEVKRLGAEVVILGEQFNTSYEHARKWSEDTGSLFVPPYDHHLVIAGQGTVAMECTQQCREEIDYMFVPVGGGGLITGVGGYMKFVSPSTKIIGIEVDESPTLNTCWLTGSLRAIDSVGKFAEGLAVKKLGELPFSYMQTIIDDSILVSADEVCGAIKDIFDDTRSIVEPSGAVSVAGAKKYLEQKSIKGATCICLLTGANVNFDRLRHISERAEIGERVESTFIVTMPERAGSLQALIENIYPVRVTEFRYQTNNSPYATAIVSLGASEIDLKEKLATLYDLGFEFDSVTDNQFVGSHYKYLVFGSFESNESEHLINLFVPETTRTLSTLLQYLSHLNVKLLNYRFLGEDYADILISLEVGSNDLEGLKEQLKPFYVQFEVIDKSRFNRLKFEDV